MPIPSHIEVDVSFGLPHFTMVGLPDATVRESRDRVRSAIRNSGFEFPSHRITVNLAPADVRKAGSSFDLPIALGLLATSGSADAPRRRRHGGRRRAVARRRNQRHPRRAADCDRRAPPGAEAAAPAAPERAGGVRRRGPRSVRRRARCRKRVAGAQPTRAGAAGARHRRRRRHRRPESKATWPTFAVSCSRVARSRWPRRGVTTCC